MLLGYPYGQKGYKLLDMNTHKIFTYRHVVFHETVFPFLCAKTEKPNGNADLIPWLYDDDLPPPYHHRVATNLHMKNGYYQEQCDNPESSIQCDNSESSIHCDNSESSTQCDNTESPAQSPSLSSPQHIQSSSPYVQQQPIVRHSDRNKRTPGWWSDYVIGANVKHQKLPSVFQTSNHSCKYHMSNYLSYNGLPNNDQAFIANLESVLEPTHYHQAIKNPKWIEAMSKELEALEKNKT